MVTALLFLHEKPKRREQFQNTIQSWSKCIHFNMNPLLLLAAPTWLWGRSGRHNSPPVSYVMDFIFCRCDGVSVDTVHPALLRSSSFSSPRWYHLQRCSSDVFLVSPLYVAKPSQSCFPVPLCYVLYFQSLPDVIVFLMVSLAACS